MEINGTNNGAATFAMKKALEMPNILMSLFQSSAGNGSQTANMKSPIPQPVDISSVTGKGRIIDLVT